MNTFEQRFGRFQLSFKILTNLIQLGDPLPETVHVLMDLLERLKAAIDHRFVLLDLGEDRRNGSLEPVLRGSVAFIEQVACLAHHCDKEFLDDEMLLGHDRHGTVAEFPGPFLEFLELHDKRQQR